MKIIMTGGSGFIGRNIIKSLLQNNHTILAPARNKDSFPFKQPVADFYPLNGLFYEDSMIEHYHRFDPEIILHLAALRGEGQGSLNDYYQVNVQSTQKLIEFALQQQVKLFIYFSTVGVHGTIPAKLPAGVQSPINPDSVYHITKYEGEKLVERKLKHRIPYLIIRPTITYGPGDNGFLYKLIDLVHRTRFPLIRKDILIHLLNVETISRFVNTAIEKPVFQDKEFILADHSPVKLHDLVSTIYTHFYNRTYPSFLKVPGFLYTVGEKTTAILHWTGLNISLKLLSHSWFYDTGYLQKYFSDPLSDTLTSVKAYLEDGSWGEHSDARK